MKKVLIIVAVAVMMFSGIALAGYDEAMQLYREKKYVEAVAEFRKVLPALEGEQAYVVQMHIGRSLFAQKKYDEAIVEYEKVSSIKGISTDQIVQGVYSIGHSLFNQKKYDEARLKFQECLKASMDESFKKVCQFYAGYTFYAQKQYDEALAEFAKTNHPNAVFHTGCILEKQGKHAESQAKYINLFDISGVGVSLLKTTYNSLDKVALGKEGLLNIIEKILLQVPATEANADFLGLLKSEQEKLK